jgi:transposase
MFVPESGLKLWLYREPTDMRKSYDGLAALVRHALCGDPLDGGLYTFINRRATQMKVLYFAGDGYCIWSKRLERGRFQVQWGGLGKEVLDYSAWRCLVEGIDLRSVRRLKRYRRPEGSTADRLSSITTYHDGTGRGTAKTAELHRA